MVGSDLRLHFYIKSKKICLNKHKFFKGNFPDTFTLEGMVTENDNFTNGNQEEKWQPIIVRTKLYAHREHLFLNEIVPVNTEKFTHVRLSIFPDGGISRLRVFGKRIGKLDT